MSTETNAPRTRRRKLGISTKATNPGEATETAETTEDGKTSAETITEAAEPAGQLDLPAETRERHENQDQEDDLLSNFGGGLPAVVDPFAPQLVDRTRLPDAPEERLAVYEAAIETSRGTLADTVSRARFRAEIEIGFVLDIIRSEPELYVPQYGTIENYGRTRWGYKRSTMYELMDTAPIRLAAASGKALSGNPDTKGRKALGPPAPRAALEAAPADPAAQEDDAPAETAPAETAAARVAPRPIPVELSKSVALEFVPVWRAQGEEVGLAIVAEADQKARESGRKLTAALAREVVKDWGALGTSEGEEVGGEDALLPSERARREATNKALASAAAAVEKLVATLGKLDMESAPPLDHAEAERHAKAIRAGGRWLNGNVKIPAEVVDAEIVQD
ncbi:hypothetical protein [Streptomyces sp. NPDC053541]|uniref:hypothetical protein n=1 Tax=Streptomyces sp. NPDC053541 TaxID=3365709 RepID=UPI0037D6C81F